MTRPFSCNHPSLCFVFMEDRPASTAFNCAQIYQLYELFDCFLYLLLHCILYMTLLVNSLNSQNIQREYGKWYFTCHFSWLFSPSVEHFLWNILDT